MDPRHDAPDPGERSRQLLVLRMVSSLLANREVGLLAMSSDLSADQLRGELEAVGAPLREIPHGAWEEFADRVELRPVPGAALPTLETVVPLWTESGGASRGARVRLITPEDSDLEDYWVSGFVDVTPGSEWLAIPADPIVPPEPLEVLPSRGEHPVPERWRPVLSEIVHRLVVEDYEGLQRDGIVTDVEEAATKWIEAYHDPLVDLPDSAWEWSDCYPGYEGPGHYDVLLSLWTAHQGLSLLTMEANVVDSGDDIRVEIFSVHVM
ncbi:DUF7668 domain-containing protein [Ornithinimicrobium cavernae]|uniref:DUF7668 domain-containing protein n=1 Tax=Ornithinimicrobium cavernae TaxID=2666047 RepID=UPI000D69E6CA|nr:hypothetical protein [Ornithinimicrobium cavernae]